MESGHSYLEADSMHTTIERACRHQRIYKREWETLGRGSRRKAKPYSVAVPHHHDFIAIKGVTSNIVSRPNTNGKKSKV